MSAALPLPTAPLLLDRSRTRGGVHVVDAADLTWRGTGRPGLALRCVREDRAAGQFLGLVGFEPLARSGLHQHQGVATSFFVDGGLTDHSGSAGLHDAGINLAGATHDAVAYQRTLLVSRLEAPVSYPLEDGPASQLHTGAFNAVIVNARPEVPPDLNVPVDALQPVHLPLPGTVRRTVFDYAGTGSAHRFSQLTLRPGTAWPRFEAASLLELWVRGGAVTLDGRTAHANCFAVIEPGARVQLAAPFGAVLLAWSEGPVQWPDADAARLGDPFGF